MGKIKKFACGGSFTLAITDNGLLYAWGYGDSVKFYFFEKII